MFRIFIKIFPYVFLFLVAASDHCVATKADKLLVLKSQRIMTLLKNDKVLKSYKVALGPNARGHKEREGDCRTPEGIYKICGKNPNSQFYKSLRVSYPNEQDRQRAKTLAVQPGGDIMIHGLPKSFAYLGKRHVLHDWTLGCIAVTNMEMEEIWEMVDVDTLIEIRA